MGFHVQCLHIARPQGTGLCRIGVSQQRRVCGLSVNLLESKVQSLFAHFTVCTKVPHSGNWTLVMSQRALVAAMQGVKHFTGGFEQGDKYLFFFLCSEVRDCIVCR